MSGRHRPQYSEDDQEYEYTNEREYEYDTYDFNGIAHIINTKYQTLTYFGVEKSELLGFVVNNRLKGIDRIVPIGKALEIDVIWDGYDIVRSLSRIRKSRSRLRNKLI